MNPIWISAIIAALLVIWLIFTYNRFITLRNRSKEAWSDIEVQMKRRYDLIPNLVETVRGYMAHERQVFENVTQARSAAMGAQEPREKLEKDNILSNTLKTLFAVAENYPDLKANANFLDLQRELADTENKIQAARRFYNSNVRDLNIKVDSFPSNLVAQIFKFEKLEFFELSEEAAKEPVKVKF